EKRKAEEALSDLRRQYETEVGDLQVTIKKLKKENQKVKKDLLEAQTNIAFLQSELDSLKSDYADQSLNSERDLEIIREYTEDRNSLERQIEILQTANRKLHDSNDGLRSALENSYSKFNRSLRINNISPGNTISRSSPKFNAHSPQPLGYDRSSHSPYMGEDCDSLALCDPMRRMNCDVDSLPENSSSTLKDSEYDSEVEYKHQRGFWRLHSSQESFGGDASDTDTDMVDGNHKCYGLRKAYRIVLAGDAAVGKPSFLMRLCKDEF
ncbi:Ras and EF-hand domain-containing protein, partial [Eschrichtius robustus]|nr:Ras and EF-hand domain-containing protein [Eschrichtius robustus]